MLTKDITPTEMAAQHGRFADLKPVTGQYLEREGVPPEAYQRTAAKAIFHLMSAPKPDAGAATRPVVEIPPGVSVYIVESPPGDGPALHAHMRTVETFLCLRGKFRINYGPTGDNSIELQPMDFVSVPKEVMRQFVNVADETSYLLVLIHEAPGADALDDIFLTPEVGAAIEKDFGPAAKAGLERIGMSFTANVP